MRAEKLTQGSEVEIRTTQQQIPNYPQKVPCVSLPIVHYCWLSRHKFEGIFYLVSETKSEELPAKDLKNDKCMCIVFVLNCIESSKRDRCTPRKPSSASIRTVEIKFYQLQV